MELLGMLLGGFLFMCLFVAWLAFCLIRKVRWYKSLIGFAVIGLPFMLAAVSMAFYMFVDEPLYCAASEGNTAKVQSLLRFHANPDVNFEGEPALVTAAQEGHKDVVRLLLDHKADVNCKSGWTGETPLMAANRNGHKDIARMLKKAGATH